MKVEALEVVGRDHGMRAQLRIGDDRCLVALEDHRGIFRDREIFVTVAEALDDPTCPDIDEDRFIVGRACRRQNPDDVELERILSCKVEEVFQVRR